MHRVSASRAGLGAEPGGRGARLVRRRLPGVTVEASSPALISKVRASVTDDSGQYRIPDLPPGTYKITFSLTGFTTVVREGVELTGGGVMTIGADMRVGSSRRRSR